MKKIMLIIGLCLLLLVVSGCNKNISQEVCDVLIAIGEGVIAENDTIYMQGEVCISQEQDFDSVLSVVCNIEYDYAYFVIRYNNHTTNQARIDKFKKECEVLGEYTIDNPPETNKNTAPIIVSTDQEIVLPYTTDELLVELICDVNLTLEDKRK